jgi:hypothetical protein
VAQFGIPHKQRAVERSLGEKKYCDNENSVDWTMGGALRAGDHSKMIQPKH